MNWEALDPTILGPALAAGLVVLFTHVPLGREVLRRGIIFLDLAVAQIAGLGVIAASAFLHQPHGLAIQIAALAAALAGALSLAWCEKRWPQIQEAIIGSAFVVAASLGLLILANDPHGGEHMKDLLVGQILWVGWEQIGIAALVSLVVLGTWVGLAKRRVILFYPLFALAITTSVQLVGIYLVFASLIIPALAARAWPARAGGVAFAVGLAGYACGLALSALLDLPSGPLVVICLAAFGLGTTLLVKSHESSSES